LEKWGRCVVAVSLLLVWSASEGGATAQDSSGFKLIVNAENPASTLKRAEVAQLFLERSARWKDRAAEPIDQSLRAPVRESFSAQVLHQSAEAVKTYWQRRMNLQREFPPVVKSSDQEVITLVAKRAGAIGYVAEATPLPPEVKVLKLAD